MDQDTAFPPFKTPAQHWRFTYKPSTNKQRRSLAGEGEEEAGEGDVRSFPSQKVPRQPTEQSCPPTSATRIHSCDFHSTRKKGVGVGVAGGDRPLPIQS